MADLFITVPLETDPTELAQDGYDHLEEQLPGWAPSPGNVEAVLIEAASLILAELMDVASDVPPAIFRTAGAKLHRVDPVEATQATADSTWTMVDDDGYTIPEGTIVTIEAAGDELVAFETAAEITIGPGATEGTVPLIAVEPGANASGLSADPQLVDSLAFVDSIALDSQTTGGVDAESDSDYLDRLSLRLELQADRPILARDFALMAQTLVAGVGRATAIDNYIPGVNERQQVATTGGPPTSGNLQLTYSGQTTANIAYNASAAAVQAALEALSNIAVGDVAVSGGPLPGTPVVVEFTGALAATDVAQMTATDTFDAGDVAISTLTAGAAAQTAAERAVTVALQDTTGEAVSGATKTAVDELLEEKREVNFLVAVVDPTYTEIAVQFTARAFPGWDAADIELRAEQAVTDYLDPASWGQPQFGEETVWHNQTKVRYLEVAEAINRTEGLDYIETLSIGVEGGSLGTADVTLAGAAPLPRVGTIDGTVLDPA